MSTTSPFLSSRWLNRWDVLVLPAVFALLFLLGWAGAHIDVPYRFGTPLPISLDPRSLPYYALRTTLRMALALACSFAFTFTYATLAAKSRRAERILIPLLDVLQSVPILGFLSITVIWFIRAFPGSLAGAEMAAVFAIFTSQAWNMAFSFYYSLKMLPKELYQVADVFQLSNWRRFWKLEVPYAMPGLIWNTMMSVSGGWFFVVAAEAITVSQHTVMLPGVGSYIAVAIQHKDLHAIGYAIATMLAVILLYDQLAFRPLVAWAEKFKYQFTASESEPRSWVLDFLQRSRFLEALREFIADSLFALSVWSTRWLPRRTMKQRHPATPGMVQQRALSDVLWSVAIVVAGIGMIVGLGRYVLASVSFDEIGHVFVLGVYTLTRVVVLTLLASLVWVPIGVHIGLRPALARRVQPVALFLSAFPANLLFPLFIYVIVRYSLDPEIWLSPLIILGTQWYILFNVIAGASAIPADFREAAANLGLRGWALWRRVYLPAIFPSYLTGGLTASGGAWNASVVAEVVSWGPHTLAASGIGAYIAEQTIAGDHPRVALGIAVMSLYVILFNRLFWKRLYEFAQERMALS